MTGIANQDSIACSIARARKAFGADLATIYLGSPHETDKIVQ